MTPKPSHNVHRSPRSRQTAARKTNWFFALVKDIKTTAKTLYAWIQNLRPTHVIFAHDTLMMAIASLAPLSLIDPEHFSLIGIWFVLRYAAVYSLISIAVFVWLRPNRHSWKCLSGVDVMRILLSVFYVNAIFFILQVKLLSIPDSAFRISVLTSLVSFAFLVLPRFVYYALHTSWLTRQLLPTRNTSARAIIVGATDEAENYLRQLGKHHHHFYEIVGIIDDDKTRIGQAIHGIEIIGSFSDLEGILTNCQRKNRPISTLLIADIASYGPTARPLIQLQDLYEVEILRLVGIGEMTRKLSDRAEAHLPTLEEFRTDVKLPSSLELIRGTVQRKNILFVGSNHPLVPNLWEAFAHMNVSRMSIVNFSRYESPELDLAVEFTPSNIQTKTYVDDLSSKTNFSRIIKEEKPDFVIISPEFVSPRTTESSPAQSFSLNVTPLMLALDVLRKTPSTEVFMLSSSHACHPEASIGTQYRFLEQIYFMLYSESGLVLRLPQILESPYSTPNRVLSQALSNKPILLDHPDVKRYYQSQKNATMFALNAIQAHLRTPHPLIITPDLSKPINVCETVRKTLSQLGIQQEFANRISYSRDAGNVQVKELFNNPSEKPMASKYQGLRIFKPNKPSEKMSSGLAALVKNAREGNDFEVEKTLRKLVG